MDRKTKHRILGTFVVIGFVIILLPFFQGGKDAASEVGMVKSPAFPDQSVQVAAPPQAPVAPLSAPITQQPSTMTGSVNDQPDDTINTNKAAVNAQAPDMTKQNNPAAEPAAKTNEPASASDNTTPNDGSANHTDNAAAAPDASATKTDESTTSSTDHGKISDLTPAPTTKSADDIAQMSDEVTAPEKSDMSAKETTTTSTTPSSTVAEDRVVSAEKSEPTHEKLTRAAKKTAKFVKHNRNPKVITAYKKLPIEDDGLFKLKNAVWVIQIGSFKNKANALRLVNQLRTNGYRAFIQQVSSSLGDNTRVFIGPENKQASARALASQIETNMHLHGIVISYKPLTL